MIQKQNNKTKSRSHRKTGIIRYKIATLEVKKTTETMPSKS